MTIRNILPAQATESIKDLGYRVRLARTRRSTAEGRKAPRWEFRRAISLWRPLPQAQGRGRIRSIPIAAWKQRLRAHQAERYSGCSTRRRPRRLGTLCDRAQAAARSRRLGGNRLPVAWPAGWCGLLELRRHG